MITKNFKVFVSTVFGRTTSSTETVSLPVPIKDVTGSEYSSLYFVTTNYNLFSVDGNHSTNLTGTQAANSIQLFVGTNGSEVTENDYTIDDITTLSAVGSTSFVRAMSEDGYAMTITRTLKNTSDADITIKELGMVKSTAYKKDTSAKFLFAREVLPTPLVVPAGNSFTVSMVVKV